MLRKFMKKFVGIAAAAGLLTTVFSPVTAFADGTKVVTLGADLSDSQKNAILTYFGVTDTSTVTVITVTNAEEHANLDSFVPAEQIGTRTISCAYVQPTNSGGIRVKTANLNWVTSNMIASALSTSGVKNCDVIAAAPFEVSGTGALTGVMKAYETASGTTLEPAKKEAANQEMVTTTQVADDVGQTEATQIVNEIKINVIQNQVEPTDTAQIQQIVDDAVAKAEADHASDSGTESASGTVSEENLESLNSFAGTIASQNYSYDDVKDTLEHVEENVTGSGETADDSSEGSDAADETDDAEESVPDDSILRNTDDAALGSDVITDATDADVLPDSTGETASDADSTADSAPFEITTTDSSSDSTSSAADENAGTDSGAAAGTAVFDTADSEDSETVTFGPFSLKFYVSGEDATPVSGTLTLTDADGNTAAAADLGDPSAWGAVTVTSDDLLNDIGLDSATEIHVLTGDMMLSDGSYTLSGTVTYTEPDDAGGTSEQTVTIDQPVKYVSSSLTLTADSGSFTAGGTATLTFALPDGAVSADVISSDENVIAVVPSDGTDSITEDIPTVVTVALVNAGDASLTVNYYDADGNPVSQETLDAAVFDSPLS